MDPYSVLGVSRDATEGDIKSAFRKLAMQHHPDKNPGDAAAEAKFKEINEAYQILSDPQKRAMHDAGGFRPGSGGNPFGGGNPFEFHFGFGGNGFQDFEDIFRAMHAQQSRRNQDVRVAANLSLEDAFNGRELTMNLQTPTGTKTVKARVPKGVDNGSRIRIAGAGENHFPNMPAGDLYVTIRILPHAVFTRAGADLLVRKTIDVFDAMVGCEMNVETLDGAIVVTVPKGIQSGQRVRIPNKGMPHLNNESMRGDLYVEFELQTPMNLSDEQIDLVNKIRALSQQNR